MNKRTAVMMPTVCPTSRKNTPNEARNQAKPTVSTMSGSITRGARMTVQCRNPFSSKKAAIRTDRLTMV
ncbi:hypothetical protein D3C85_1658460 [compost metagenome]